MCVFAMWQILMLLHICIIFISYGKYLFSYLCNYALILAIYTQVLTLGGRILHIKHLSATTTTTQLLYTVPLMQMQLKVN